MLAACALLSGATVDTRALQDNQSKNKQSIAAKKTVVQESPAQITARMFPTATGEFQVVDKTVQPAATLATLPSEDYGVVDAGSRIYATVDGAPQRYNVEIIRTESASAAYSLLTSVASDLRWRTNSSQLSFNDWSDAQAYAVEIPNVVALIKDKVLIRVEGAAEANTKTLNVLARTVAAKIDGEAGGVPVLVRHLPNWEQVAPNIDYAVSLNALKSKTFPDSVLNALDFSGGTEAATALYAPDGSSAQANFPAQATRLVIVEHLTPQLASENLRRVDAVINERRANNQSVPTLFNRTGNYLVFVFNAPDEKIAVGLANRVRYEQDVRWLGDDPFLQQKAERYYTTTTLGMLLASLKIAALGIALCLCLGGVVGGFVFMRRRSQSAQTNVYSDAGGMVRLNIDALTDAPKNNLLSSNNAQGSSQS